MRQPRERPEEFTIDPRHPLAEGLVLGPVSPRSVGSRQYNTMGARQRAGTLFGTGPGWAPNRRGNVKGALVFNGTNDYVDLASAYSLGAFTVSGWMNFSVFSTEHGILLGDAVNADWIRVREEVTTLRMQSTVYTLTYLLSRILSTDTWYFVTLVREGDSVLFYVNGDQWSSVSVSAAETFRPSRIGGEETRRMSGYIDDTLIHSRALSVTENSALADPTNVMLSLGRGDPGMLVTRRKWHVIIPPPDCPHRQIFHPPRLKGAT